MLYISLNSLIQTLRKYIQPQPPPTIANKNLAIVCYQMFLPPVLMCALVTFPSPSGRIRRRILWKTLLPGPLPSLPSHKRQMTSNENREQTSKKTWSFYSPPESLRFRLHAHQSSVRNGSVQPYLSCSPETHCLRHPTNQTLPPFPLCFIWNSWTLNNLNWNRLLLPF